MKTPIKATAALSRFETARAALDAFLTDNEDTFEEYERLITDYNNTLSEARSVYKDNHSTIGPSFGDFKRVLITKIDVELLLKLMPETEDLVTFEPKIDREEYTKAVSNGNIPQKVVNQIESQSVQIRGPKEMGAVRG